MKMIFVDGKVDEVSVKVFNLEEGTLHRSFVYDGNVSEQVNVVMNILHDFEPSKIIFDKNGFGLAVYEKFVKKLDKTRFAVDKEGNVTVKPFKIGDKVVGLKSFMHHYGLGRGVMKFSDEGDTGVIVDMWNDDLNDQMMLSVALPTLQLVVPMSTFKEVFRKVDNK